jgi:large subunit ribosomal protein L9
MKVILKKRVPNLGLEWDIVSVKDGYARNFLLPRRLADIATPAMIESAQKKIAERVKKMEELVANAKETAQKIAKIELVFTKKAKGKKLYGSITEKEIQEMLAKEHKLEVSKEAIRIKEHLKEIGDHKVTIHLAEGVDVPLKITIEAIEEGK